MANLEFYLTGDVAVKVVVTETDGALRFDLAVVQPGEAGYTGQIGELNGLFFDMAGNVDLYTGMTVSTDTGTLDMDVDEGDVSNLGGGVNVKGEVVKTYGEFDVGVLTDPTGLGNGDLQAISFTLTADQALTLEDVALMDFAVRLTSVGDPDGDRSGSSKIGGTAPEAPPEEPVAVHVANDDAFTVDAEEMFGDVDDFILVNDTTESGTVVSPYAGEVVAVQNTVIGAPVTVAGDNGGLMIVNADGSVDFSANGEFDDLTTEDSDITTFTYEIDGGDTAVITVEVIGTQEPIGIG